MNIDEINMDASNVPITSVSDPNLRDLIISEKISRYEYKWSEGFLDALLIDKGSDTLVVSLHGAVNRGETRIPRFERLKSLKDKQYSCLFLSDPTLHLQKDLALSWYIGWRSIDMHRLIAKWIVKFSASLGIDNVIISGSSGGGFAALQISSFIPNSIALAFNAQTDISRYKVNGSGLGAQRNYIKCVRPDIWDDLSEHQRQHLRFDWNKYYDDRYSAVERYKSPMVNYAVVVENDEEFHYGDHYLPFLEVLKERQDRGRYRCYTYSGGTVHNPPTYEIFFRYLQEAVQWARTLPPVSRIVADRPGKLSWFDRISDRVAGLDNTYDSRLNDKLFFNDFALRNEIPVAKIIESGINVFTSLTVPKHKDFVIKPNNLSSNKGVLILSPVDDHYYRDLRSKKEFNEQDIRSFYRKLLDKESASDGTLIFQERIYDRGRYEIPRDFKFYVFKSRVRLIQCIDRNRTPMGVAWFDENFEHLHIPRIKTNPKYSTRVGFSRPPESDALIALAEKVARLVVTPFVRVDLYSTPRGPVCGEVTFTPGGPYYELTDSFDEQLQCELGALWN